MLLLPSAASWGCSQPGHVSLSLSLCPYVRRAAGAVLEEAGITKEAEKRFGGRGVDGNGLRAGEGGRDGGLNM